ncbi:MAG: geranylgeranyl reductase family protein [Anaerolineales bacterium]|nr:geranylgeranyl reductase family protein [Chloroflexota bacterium]MBL6981198.1 geranylgeranyl reductase family protein [Anaerolineales bacterium]
MNTVYDVAIIGAGPGGSTTASYLAKAGVRVLLLDKSEFPRDKTCGDALSPNALKILGDLNLIDKLIEFGHRLNGIRLVAPNGNELVAPIPPKHGFVEHLYIAPRIKLDDLLLQNSIALGAEFKSNVRVTDLRVDSNKVTITGKSANKEQIFFANVGVIAVGANTALLQKLGFLSKLPEFAVAARAYYNNLPNLDDLMEIRFDGVPLPGYGWIFPTSKTSANIGAGFLRKSKKLPFTAKEILDKFLDHGPVREKISLGQRQGVVKGYPLRMDFATARVHSNRIILVGEAAGLVNPFTGEGIDYAMESGQIAARVLIDLATTGDYSFKALHSYDRNLRKRFQRLFVWTTRLRSIYINEWLLNPLIRAANHEKSVEKTILEVLLSYRNAIQALSPSTLYHVLTNL